MYYAPPRLLMRHGRGMNAIALKTSLLVGRLIIDYQMNCGG